MKDARIRASHAEIAKSLQGNWRTEHLFSLQQALAMFDFIGTQVADCDREIEAQLSALQAHDGEPPEGKKKARARNPCLTLQKISSITTGSCDTQNRRVALQTCRYGLNGLFFDASEVTG